MLDLPFMGEIFETIQHRIKTKVHRTHIERCQFRLKGRGWLHPLFDGHVGTSTGGDVDHGIGRLLYFGKKLFKDFWILSRATCFRIPCVKMQNGSSSLGCCNGCIGDLFWCHGQVF